MFYFNLIESKIRPWSSMKSDQLLSQAGQWANVSRASTVADTVATAALKGSAQTLLVWPTLKIPTSTPTKLRLLFLVKHVNYFSPH